MNNEDYFVNKVVLITGAGGGIGSALATELAQMNAILCLSDISADRLASVSSNIQRMVPGIHLLQRVTDVGAESQVKELFDKVLDFAGRIDVLINSAGLMLRRKSVDSIPFEEVNNMMMVNFYGLFHCCSSAIPIMRKQETKGHIVNITSFGGRRAVLQHPGYVASKFAATGYSDFLRQQLYGSGISVTTVYPTWVRTALIEGVERPRWAKVANPEEIANEILKSVKGGKSEITYPSGRIAKLFLLMNLVSINATDGLVRRFNMSHE